MFNKELVKKLRKQTNAPITLCVKALQESDDDFEKAVVYLKKQGALKAQDLNTRSTFHGVCLAKLAKDSKSAVIIKLVCETDFVAKNKDFTTVAHQIAEIILKNSSDFSINKKINSLNGVTVQDLIKECSAKVGENIGLEEFETYAAKDNSFCVIYNHHNQQNACVLQVCSFPNDNLNDSTSLAVIYKDVAMQISALKPKYAHASQMDQTFITNEKKIFTELALKENPNKPKNVLEQIVKGRLNKQLKDYCLLTQPFIKDSKISVNQYLTNNKLSKDNILRFVRFEI